MDDVIKLVTATRGEPDVYGNITLIRESRSVFCDVRSVSRSEFYQAAQTDLHPQYVFVLSHYKDYLGEKEIMYTDWTGTEKLYNVLRVYRPPESDQVEITVQEQITSGS